MLDTAIDLASSGKGHLFEFVQFLEEQSTPGVQAADAPLMGEERNTVTLMTIHASKGLEYPVIILPDTSAQPGSSGGRLPITFHADLGLVARESSDTAPRPAIWDFINAANKEEELAEDARVLYVALTRAMDHLVISGTVLEKEVKKKDDETELTIKNGSWLAHFDDVFSLCNILDSEAEPMTGISVIAESQDIPKATKPASESILSTNMSSTQIGPVAPPEISGPYISTSDWLDSRFPGPKSDTAEFNPAQAMAMMRGTIVHRFFEVWNPGADDPTNVDRFLSREFPAFAGDDAMVDFLRSITKTFHDSDLSDIFTRGISTRRELPFTVKLGDQWISGTIDALTSSGILIDYKTGQRSKENLERYETQIQFYAHALEILTGTKPIRGVLYFVESGHTHDVDLSDPTFL
jgi:ATP-dependent helicase/nuclease subunit A